MTKFIIIISYKEEMHLPRRNATISQNMDNEECKKFMDKEECKNFLVTKHNISPHSFISMKFSSGCDHLFHEECGNFSRTSASNDLSRGCSSSPNLWI
jgi:hypothetical protein